MATAATSLLGLALPVTGELQGTWGDTVNNSITSLLDSAVAGTTTLSTDGDVTLTTTTLAANQARQAILLCSGARTAIRTITAPAQSKIYTIINSTTGGYAVKIVGVGPTTGVTIGSGQSAQVAWNGSDFVQVGASAGGSNTQVQYNNNGALAGSANLTFNGTTLTAANTSVTTSETLSYGTANGVAYLNGSKVVTTGSVLTFDGAILGVNGVSVGRGAGAVSTNTAVGANALNANTTSSLNTAFGYNALALADANNNSAFGYNALSANTSGTPNSAFGRSALASNTTGGNNTGIGMQALTSNTTANNNVAVGYQAGYSNTTAANNTAIGTVAGFSTTTGAENTSLGSFALYTNSTGNYNVAIGRQALQLSTTASNNTAVGCQAGYSNTTGAQNTFIGLTAGYSNTTGSYSTAVGWESLKANTTGRNTAYGIRSLFANTTGSANTALGDNAMGVNTTGDSNTAVGYSALEKNTTASNNTAVGYQAGYSNTTSSEATYVGNQAGYSVTTGVSNTFIGRQAGYSVTTGYANTFIGGGWSGNNLASGYYVTTGARNTILGNYNGNQGSLNITTSSNYIVLSDGDGNPRGIFDNSGRYIVGTTTAANGASGGYSPRITSYSTVESSMVINDNTATAAYPLLVWQTATTGNNLFVGFFTEGVASITLRGNIDYNRTGGAVRYNTTSDATLKNLIGDAPRQKSIDILNSTRLREFSWKDDPTNKPQIGPLAQELYETYKGAVSVGGEETVTDNEGNEVKRYRPWAVDKTAFTFHLVAGFQHLFEQVQELKSELDSVKAELATLKGA